jgi:hypothetical protein
MPRAMRKDEKQRDRRRAELGLPESVPLLPEAPEDATAAALVAFGDDRGGAKARRRAEISSSSIFSRSAVAAAKVPADR